MYCMDVQHVSIWKWMGCMTVAKGQVLALAIVVLMEPALPLRSQGRCKQQSARRALRPPGTGAARSGRDPGICMGRGGADGTAIPKRASQGYR